MFDSALDSKVEFYKNKIIIMVPLADRVNSRHFFNTDFFYALECRLKMHLKTVE